VSRSRLFDWILEQKELICSYIRYIIRAAIASSPSTSPFKSDEAKEAALASFGTEGAMFDYGISLLDKEDESSESSELPNMDFSII
jgi:hypothetical protein